jgi:hypothetical protein
MSPDPVKFTDSIRFATEIAGLIIAAFFIALFIVALYLMPPDGDE